MELAFTLAKNTTKPNPFEIIPLQTTRKENNWKTEEVLVRAAVTLETERIQGTNPNVYDDDDDDDDEKRYNVTRMKMFMYVCMYGTEIKGAAKVDQQSDTKQTCSFLTKSKFYKHSFDKMSCIFLH